MPRTETALALAWPAPGNEALDLVMLGVGMCAFHVRGGRGKQQGVVLGQTAGRRLPAGCHPSPTPTGGSM